LFNLIPTQPILLNSRADFEIPIREHKTAAVGLDEDYKTVFEKYGGEFFVVCNGGGISTGITEDNLVMIAVEPDLVRRKVMLQAEHGRAFGRALAKSPYPLVLVGGGDLAGNNGPIYSPESFRQIMLPALKHMMEEFKNCGIHYVFRSDGNLWPIMDMLFKEAGCQGYGEADRACGMTVKALRARYPKLVIWGNFSSDQLLRQSASWIRDETQRIFAESGGTGYFNGASNAILKGTPVENVLALF
jgi:uroporphyrinogen decarboxylase